MTILGIVGAGGAVGHVVTKQLLTADKSLHVVALLRGADPELAQLPRCDVVEGGLFDCSALERTLKNSDLVINLAARNPGGDEADWAAREDFFVLNGLGAGLVAAMAERHQLPLIHFSTVSVYETAAYVAGRRMTEDDPMPCLGQETADFYERVLGYLSRRVAVSGPLAENDSLLDGFKRYLAAQSYSNSTPIYGLSKLIGERLALTASRRACSIRMSDAYGPGHESRGVIIDHLNQLRDSENVSVDFGSRKGVYFIFIDDIARLLASLMDRLLSNQSGVPRVTNFCGDRIDSAGMHSHLKKLCGTRRLNRDVRVAPSTTPQFDRRYSRGIFDRYFPAFEITDFGAGLGITLDELGPFPGA